tara:strand:+ start:1473 stop:2384 length:912 start_codon:yes stop_codon:yes gene_type:complete
MLSKKKKFIFTDMDLDGAMSYLLFLWFNNNKYIPHISCRVTDFNKTFSTWTTVANNPKRYDLIYILDLDISQDSAKLADKDNVIIIDHHSTHVTNQSKYKIAKTFITEESSCAKHIYSLLHKQSNIKLTDAQKYLLLLVDDYDSYRLQLKESHSLNLLFWNYQGDRVAKFIRDFKNGFTGFSDKQQTAIEFHNRSITQTLAELNVFEATIPISGKRYKFTSTFASKHINDVAHYIIHQHNADVGVVINLESKKVSFRKNKDVDVDVSKVASKLTDGGGHKYAAGGVITAEFLLFSKLFKPLHE